ncbi:MAG: TlpA family protein disulfide reductase [Planctomycetes bacterium]|nr:TlpA family protein disulfide reductase [Planctomycetota bacterium]
MIPHERELVERLKNEPFALLGINSDGDAETVKKILEKEKIAWRQAIDGSTSGPLATKWGVNGWPTIYVLDAKGVIRHKGPRGKELEEAVVKLIAEAKAAK